MAIPKFDNRKIILGLAALLLVAAAALGLSFTRKKNPPAGVSKAELAAAQKERLQEACASSATYARLKEVAFEEAIRIRNADPANLDTLATHSVVRMENPVVMSRDEDLNVTVCSGRFVLELPPGAERGFGGERRLVADVEYAAQAAADGSGLVYQIEGAEPIVYKLAAFDLRGQRFQPPAAAPAVAGDEAVTEFAEAALPPLDAQPPPPHVPPADTVRKAEALPPPAPKRAKPAVPDPPPVRRAEPRPESRPAASRSSTKPSFNCRHAGTRSERMVCGNGRLAELDRTMSSQFYSALSRADPRTRRALRSSRDRFLAYRERCRSEACVADAYEGRMMEIRDIAAEAE
ncbi:MAG TPA: hypothetical protein VGW34_03355 [Allosphingosinicella sp.]|nr:hypothetical protein [Allosphingosinicella sp.]